MRRGGAILCIVALVAVVASAGNAAAHAAPQPLDNEVHVLEDDARDEFYWYDGYDLHHLHVREAHWETLNETGFVFRFTLYGGFAPGEVSDAMHVDIEATGPDGNQTVRFTTTDDKNWTSETGHVLFSDVTEDEPPYTGVTAAMQVLIPYETFGVETGDTLESVTMYSYADDDLRDKAPGGIYLPMSSGQGEVPQDSSKRLVDALEVNGPSGYVEASIATTGTEATIDVTNVLANGQHVALEVPETAGWNVTDGGFRQASLDIDESVSFLLNASAAPTATEPLPIHLVTDLGGHRTFYLGVNGTALETGLEPASVDVAPEQPTKESPGAGTAALLGALAAIALAARQRRIP